MPMTIFKEPFDIEFISFNVFERILERSHVIIMFSEEHKKEKKKEIPFKNSFRTCLTNIIRSQSKVWYKNHGKNLVFFPLTLNNKLLKLT